MPTAGIKPRSAILKAEALTTKSTRQWTIAATEVLIYTPLLRLNQIFTIPGRRLTTQPSRKQPSTDDVCLTVACLLACLTSQQHASVSLGPICSDKFTCCHTETEAADQTFYLTQSQYTDTGPTSPRADSITPSTWQGRHCVNF